MTFVAELQCLIDQTYSHTWHKFEHVKTNARLFGLKKKTIDTWRTPGEPAFVAELATYPFARRQLANLIERHLSPKISSGKPLVSGVFVHQKPKVRFGSPSTEIELGDMLFVRHHFRSKAKSPEGRAFLLQAKSITQPTTGALTGKEEKQFDLYANWDTPLTFPYGDIGPPPGTSKKWNLSKGPKPHVDSGFYGLVSKDGEFVANKFPDDSAWAVGPALAPRASGAKSVAATGSLAHALHSFLIGSHGRPWTLGASTDDHWSNFVEEVLERSLDWKTQVQRLQLNELPRQASALAFVDAFATANAVEDVTHAAYARPDDIGMGELDRIWECETASIQEQRKAWLDSGGELNLRGSKVTPPAGGRNPARGPGGMSVLYVATFGEGSLEEPKPQR